MGDDSRNYLTNIPIVNLTKHAKRIVKKMPPIKALVTHRDTLLKECDTLRRERDQIRQQLELAKQNLSGNRAQIADLSLNSQVFASELLEKQKELDALIMKFGEVPFVPNGHFYSPIASREEVIRDSQRIFSETPKTIHGIDIRDDAQMEVVREIASYYPSLPFQDEKVEGLRYRYTNDAFSYTDAIFLNGMIRHVKPRNIIEIGSGHSSAMTLDTNERWFNNSIKCTFIEPYPALLHSLLMESDRDRITIHPDRVQDVSLDVYDALETNDILFVDSTHVSKVGSDVNHIVFEVLPKLANGVYIHFHDIFFPFEYPRPWIAEGRAWNELYLLQAFLQDNGSYEIVLFNNYIVDTHQDYFAAHMPRCLKNPGGSLWLRKC